MAFDNETVMFSFDKTIYMLESDTTWIKVDFTWPKLAQVASPMAVLNGEIYFFEEEIKGYNWKLTERLKAVRVPDMIQRRRVIKNCIVALNGCIWVVGGHNDEDPDNGYKTVEKYDPATNKWSFTPPMKHSRTYPAAGAFNGKIYVAGCGRRVENIPMECFDPNTGIWTDFISLPIFRRAMSMVTSGSNLIVLGGYGTDGTDYADVWCLDVDNMQADWKMFPPMITPRSDHRALSVGNFIVVLGGMNAHGRLTSVEIFDGATWRSGPHFNIGGNSGCVVVPTE